MSNELACFKAYDIRGRVPDELDAELAYRIGRAFAAVVEPRRVVVGYDIRLSGPELSDALCQGLNESGVDVLHIGLCGTEEVYFATPALEADGGVMITASHNPKDYNGMKLVRGGSRPISGDTGLGEIGALASRLAGTSSGSGGGRSARGIVEQVSVREAYIEHLLGYVDRDVLEPLTLISNAGNGCAGPIVEALAPHLPFRIVPLHHTPDGTFPNGVPNPLLPENRPQTANAVLAERADFGVAWDGDFDRCFFFDESGGFIEGYYIVGLLASQLLSGTTGEKVIYDPRLVWNTIELTRAAGGVPVQCKSGHAFIKERMRSENAIYGGEMSAHHYFRDFNYCDSGMIPWLLVAQAVSTSGRPLSELVAERMHAFPASGEINRGVDGDVAIARVRARYEAEAQRVEEVDGVTLEFADWRLNLRKSNTEPLVRLNVEARGSDELMRQRTEEVLALIDS
ncbi:MAG: phosphomannomutase CpsG [Myxococcales bacterium]|nr:phosphomannomutase CpsG [Myxococcales bacterium]